MYYDLQEKKSFEIRARKWMGSYDSFLKFLIEYKEACEDHPGYIIEASR